MSSAKIKIHALKGNAADVNVPPGLKLEQSYTLTGSSRGVSDTDEHVIDLSGDKVAEFVFDDESSWICDAESLHEIFPEVDVPTRSNEPFSIPAKLHNPVSDRGFFGDIVLKAVNIFLKKKVSGAVGDVAGKLEDKQLDKKEGLFRLENNDGELTFETFKPDPANKAPYLVFIHGTNSSTGGAYGKLFSNKDAWDAIKTMYDKNILAFQHRTLTESPLKNAIQLTKALPDDAEIHIISHSRGGIIADILCRYTRNKSGKFPGFSKMNMDLLKKEDRKTDIKDINTLNDLFSDKKISVTNYVRVACPASGTILASKRISTILNVFFNLLGGNKNPAVDILKTLIAETVKTKDNVEVLPGIEAMNPDSPFIKVLNDFSDVAIPTDTPLAVISGSSKAGVNFKALKIILLRLFFQQRNDLVVNTDSMYLGSKRKTNIQYFFDEGSKVDHFDYFGNSKTREALLLALKTATGEPIPGYASVAQLEVPASDRGIFGLEGGELMPEPPSGKKPIVILLPGIMGSTLAKRKNRIWINYLRFLAGDLSKISDINDTTITPRSLIRTSYEKLTKHLSADYDVVIYPFDWRKQLNVCAAEFNDAIIKLMDLARENDQPIKIIGHSMGGVLVRDFIINHEATWQKLKATKGFRLLFLGSPLGGSFRIPAVLYGNDSIINSLSKLDQRHTKRELLEMFSQFPGILSLLPLTTEENHDFANQATWQKMSSAYGDTDWPVPDLKLLNEFGAYRDKILAFQSKIDYSNAVYIAGKDKTTPCDYMNGKNELVFFYTGEGDQSVTWDSGIPKKMADAGSVYYVNVTHGALANNSSMFDGISEILERGSTSQFSTTRPSVRGEEKKFRRSEIFQFDLTEQGIENTILGLAGTSTVRPSQVPINVSVAVGDLSYAKYPVLAGHFKNDGILYAEAVIDSNLKFRLSSKHKLEIYPGDIGTSDIILDGADDQFPGAIIVGLGIHDDFTPNQLSRTVEQGVANYLLNVSHSEKELGISALLIGSGYGNLTIEGSVKAIIEGVNSANQRILDLSRDQLRPLRYIEFIEMYEDKSLNCMHSLRRIERNENSLYNIKVNTRTRELFGSKKRLIMDEADRWWQRITVRHKEIKEGKDGTIKTDAMVFNSSTADAREDERELRISTSLIDGFVTGISTDDNWDQTIAKAVFELMIPNEFKHRLKRRGNMSWILDEKTAAYPWELLQDSVNNTRPFCVNAGMIRQLSTRDFPPNINRARTNTALVIGDPVLPADGELPQLPGAKLEADTVNKLLLDKKFETFPLIRKRASEILLHLMSNDYKIIHLAGHGIFTPESESQTGMVIGKNEYLTTFNLAQLPAIPELVFVNCCHLGKIDPKLERYYMDRYKFAANIGTQLIKMGVKAVVVAGWKVNDDAAHEFAEVFYRRMLEGVAFGDAVRDARRAIYHDHNNNNTWGAYQCYGDPFYTLSTDATWEFNPQYISAMEAEVHLANLASKLDTKGIRETEAFDQLQRISKAVALARIGSSEIIEKEAIIYLELGRYKEATERFIELFKEKKAGFSVIALEKFCNVRAKYAVEQHLALPNSDMHEVEIEKAIKHLEYLLEINGNQERFNLLGSAYKRKAVVCRPGQRDANLAISAYYYYKASEVCGHTSVYSLLNWYTLEMLRRLNKKTEWKNEEEVRTSVTRFINGKERSVEHYTLPSKEKALRQIKAERIKNESMTSQGPMDFWAMLGTANLLLCEIILRKKADQQSWKELKDAYVKIWRMAGSPAKRKTETENLQLLHTILKYESPLKKQLKKLEEELKSIGH